MTAANVVNIAEGVMNALKGTFPHFRCPVDLHDPAIDATGRLDVLCARTVKLVVERVPDPMMKLWYSQFSEAVDAGIYHTLHQHNVAKSLEKMGLAPKAKRVRKPRKARPDVGTPINRTARPRRQRRDNGLGMGGEE